MNGNKMKSHSDSYHNINTEMSKVSIEDEQANQYSSDGDVKKNSTRLQLMYPAAGCVYLGALAIGTVIGYPAMAITSMVKSSRGTTISVAMSDSSNVAWFNSIMALAALFGAFIAGPLSNSVGRRTTLIICCFPFAIGWLLIALAEVFSLLIGGRILTGISTGMVCVAGPVYIVEVASHETRGLLGGLFGGIIATGILLCGIFGGLFLEWQGLAALNSLLPMLTAVILLFMPQSPKLLLSKGRIKEAVRSLRKLHGEHIDTRRELSIMKDNEEQHEELSIQDLLSKSTLKAAGVAVCLMLFQIFCGINAVMVYAVPILQQSAPSVNPIYCTIMLQAVQALFNTLASPITNRFGRKPPMILSAVGMCVSLFGFGYYQYSKVDGYAWIPVICCVTAVISFSVGFGPLPWLIVAEIAPTKVSGLISALATSTNWASFFVLIRTFDSLVTSLSSSVVFWMYSAWCFMGILFSVFLLPETGNKSHFEIQMMLEGRTPTREQETKWARDSPKILVENEQHTC